MALSRELTHRLEDVENVPLPKRLKLAENAFTRTDLRVTGKEYIALKWLCRLATEETKEDTIIWSTLLNCLISRSTCGNSILKSKSKDLLIETLVTKLNQPKLSQAEDVLHCCDVIFSSYEMQRYFKSKPLSLCNLMKGLFFQLCKSTKSQDNYDTLGQKCVASFIECFVNSYKQSQCQDDFVELFLCEILYPLCSLMQTVVNDKLGAEIHKCIQKLIFQKSRYTQFQEIFGNENGKNFASKIFDELKRNSESLNEETTLVVFTYVFRAAVTSYKNDAAMMNGIFKNLIDSAGNVKYKLLARLACMPNITFDYQSKIGGTTLFEYLANLIDEIIASEVTSDSTSYDALAGIAILNPLIIETKLQNVLKKILIARKSTVRVKNSYERLMVSILEAGIRLRREQKLVPWILSSIKESLENCETSDVEIDDILPNEFRDKFSKCITNMTSKQMTEVFRSLIFHFNANCVAYREQPKASLVCVLEAIAALIVAFFKGVRIFDQSIPLDAQRKFVAALGDFALVLELFIDVVHKPKRDKKLVNILLTLTWYWNFLYNSMNYYIPNSIVKPLAFPVSDAKIQRLIQMSEKARCEEIMNKILVQRMLCGLQDRSSLDFSSLQGGLEKAWSTLTEHSPQLLSMVKDSQLNEISHLVLEYMKSSDSATIVARFSGNIVDNDKFVTALVCQILLDVATNVNPEITKYLTQHLDTVDLLDSRNIGKVLKDIKKKYVKFECLPLDEKSIAVIETDFNILCKLPLTYLSVELKTLIFLVVYAIHNETRENTTVKNLCTQIILDVTEKSDVNIINYIDFVSLVRDLTHNPAMQRVAESSLRSISSWESLKVLVKESQANPEAVAALLRVIETVRPKLKNEQKEFFKKAAQKLCKNLLDRMEEEINDYNGVKRLISALKVATASDEIPESLIAVANSTLERIFISRTLQSENILTEGFQLVKVVLKQRSKFNVSDEIIDNIWPLVIKNPCEKLIPPLFDATGPKSLEKLLNLLHTQTISGINESNEIIFNNALIVFGFLMNPEMNLLRNKLRSSAILNVLQILQSMEIPAVFWPAVLRLVQRILSKHSHVIDKHLVIILELIERSLREIELSTCHLVLAIFYSLVKYNIEFATNQLPVLLDIYRRVASLVIRESRKDVDAAGKRQLEILALDFEKLTNALAKQKKDLTRLCPYVINDLVSLFAEGVIPAYVKIPMEQSVGHFLGISDQHVMNLLARILQPATHEIFKTLYENYTKFHKFTGKI